MDFILRKLSRDAREDVQGSRFHASQVLLFTGHVFQFYDMFGVLVIATSL